jgi:uncharacterized membrane protein
VHTCLLSFSLSIGSSIHAGLKDLIFRLELVLILVLEVEHFAIFAHGSVPTLEKFRFLQ